MPIVSSCERRCVDRVASWQRIENAARVGQLFGRRTAWCRGLRSSRDSDKDRRSCVPERCLRPVRLSLSEDRKDVARGRVVAGHDCSVPISSRNEKKQEEQTQTSRHEHPRRIMVRSDKHRCGCGVPDCGAANVELAERTRANPVDARSCDRQDEFQIRSAADDMIFEMSGARVSRPNRDTPQ